MYGLTNIYGGSLSETSPRYHRRNLPCPYPNLVRFRRAASTTELLSLSNEGTPGHGSSWNPAISGDGRYVAFVSDAHDLVVGDTNGTRQDVFVRDRLNRTTERVSVSDIGSPWDGGNDPSINVDGRYVAFAGSDYIVPDDTNGCSDVFVRDRLNRRTELVSSSTVGVPANGCNWLPSVSSDGRYVAFVSHSYSTSNLVAYPIPVGGNIFIGIGLQIRPSG